MKKLSRQYIINVAYSVVGKPLQEWVMKQVDLRNRNLSVKQNLLIDLDPEISKIFQSSTDVSRKCLSFYWLCILSYPYYLLYLKYNEVLEVIYSRSVIRGGELKAR